MIDLTDDAYKIAQNIEDVNIYYITTLAGQVNDMVNAGPELNIAEQREIASLNIRNIKKEMDKAVKISTEETNALLSKEAKNSYKSMRKFYKKKRVVQLPFNKNRRMLNQMRAIYSITDKAFTNLSRTTAMSVQYQRCIDQSIMAITSGAENYEVAVDRAVRQAVKRGSKVKYASGYQRRNDTAVRMNVLDGARQMQIEVNRIAGEEFGADGVEIDAHGLCAEDHLDIQGKTFACEDYGVTNTDDLIEAINTEEIESDRGIGEWNCQHIATPIVIGVSKPAYSEDELNEINEYSTEEIPELNNATRYEASQMMRQLETQVRENEEQIIQATIRNRPGEIGRYKSKNNRAKKKYKYICDKAGLRPQYNRMKIVR